MISDTTAIGAQRQIDGLKNCPQHNQSSKSFTVPTRIQERAQFVLVILWISKYYLVFSLSTTSDLLFYRRFFSDVRLQ